MAPADAFVAISKLLSELTERIKDGKTAALVQQVQANYQAIQAGYFSAEQRAQERHRELIRLETLNATLQQKVKDAEKAHAAEISALKESHAAEMAALQESYRADIARLASGPRSATGM
jgi:predicted  nucleic acid-binding Zn-ribbon protein